MKWESQYHIIPESNHWHKDIYKYYRKFSVLILPEDLIDAVDACKTNADVKQVELNGPFSNHELKLLEFRFALLFYGKIRKY
jgi:hypothetical protein